jgi:bifunctional UDP-N-acetylglucosamine pyrophosphorylase / glucosamine-1-phosphate N-acetyltransferase
MRNQIVILAAGKGTRMGSSRVPKVLVMLKDKPLILYVLEEIEKVNQLAKPVIVVGYQAEKVKNVLGNGYSYALQKEQFGTADALMSARRNIKAENILVVYGDMPFIKAESLKALLALHFKKNANISILTTQVENFKGPNESVRHFARILRDPISHNIIGNVEFKDANDQQKKLLEINPGIYAFNTKWLWENLKKIENKNAQREYYLTDIIPLAASQGQTINNLMIDTNEAFGINSLEDLKRAEKLLK